ncbi:MAG: tetratricopeptide repeat protein [Planctomycetota bacterium]
MARAIINRRRVFLALAAIGAAVLAVFLFPSAKEKPRLVLIGIDGADWGIVRPLMAEGVMPHLKSLVDAGVSAPLRTIEPILSPVIWTTIATGRDPADHGIGWFMSDTTKGERVPVTSNARRTKALWNILPERGKTVSVLGWWATYPAEEIAGEMISDFFAFHNFGVTGADLPTDLGRVWPPELLPRVESLLVDRSSLTYEDVDRFLNIEREEWESTRSQPFSFGNPVSHFGHILSTALSYARIGEELLSRKRDLTAIYFEAVDSVSHLFMKFAPPKIASVSEVGFERYKDAVREFYILQDEILGRLLAHIDPETYVMVVSDHGFRHGEARLSEGDTITVPQAHLWHTKEGIFVLKGPGVRRGVTLPQASVFDVTPTVLYLLDLPVADDMPGRILVDALELGSLKECSTIESYESGAPPERGESRALAKTSVHDLVEDRLRALGYVAEGDQSSPESHFGVAAKLMEQKEWVAAERELRKAIRMRPDSPDFHYALARCLTAQGKTQAACSSLDQTLALAPGSFAALCARGELALLFEQPQQAVPFFERAHQAAPARVLPLVGLGDALNRLGRPQEALGFLSNALELDPTHVTALYNLAVVHDSLGNREQSVHCYQQVLEKEPAHMLALTNLGSIHCEEGKYQEAIGLFETAIAGGQITFEACYNLGTAYLQLGLTDKAIPRLEKALDMQPESKPALMNMALAYLRNGQALKSYQTYLALARLHPDCYDAWLQSGLLASTSDQPAQAAPLLEKARVLDPERFARDLELHPELNELLGKDE